MCPALPSERFHFSKNLVIPTSSSKWPCFENAVFACVCLDFSIPAAVFQAAGRHPHGEQALPGLRVSPSGPKEVHGLLHCDWHPATSCKGKPPLVQRTACLVTPKCKISESPLYLCVFLELPLPAAARPGLLPLSQGSSSRPETPESPHQCSGGDQASGLWSGTSVWCTCPNVHS